MASTTFLSLMAVISQTKASSQYVAVKEKKKWSDANQYCADTYGTTLATVRNDFDADDVFELHQDIYSGETPDATWVGLNDLDQTLYWQWVSGFPCDSDDGNCDNLKWWESWQDNNEHCVAIYEGATETDSMLRDRNCDSKQHYFICDAPVMGNRMAAVETGLSSVQSDVVSVESDVASMKADADGVELRMQSLEKIIDDFNVAIDAERSQSVSVPVGFGIYGDFALYTLAIANVVVLVVMFVYCVLQRASPKVQYGKVVMYDTDKV